MKNLKISLAVACAFLIAACGVVNKKNKGKGMNFFTIEQDKELGAQVAAQIDADTVQFPLLDSVQYADVYKYIYKVYQDTCNIQYTYHHTLYNNNTFLT